MSCNITCSSGLQFLLHHIHSVRTAKCFPILAFLYWYVMFISHLYVHWIDRHMCVHVHCVYKLDNQHLDKSNISWKHTLTRYCNIYQLMIAIFSKVSSQAAAIYMPYLLHCEDIKLVYTLQNNHFSIVKLISSVMLW